MPTYVCTIRTGALDSERKAEVAEQITRVHHEVTGAPRVFVQVLFHEIAVEDQFVGGRRPLPAELWVRGDIRAGRSAEDRARLLHGLIRGASLASDIPESSIWVYLDEHEAANLVEFGQQMSEPGRDAEWLAAMPEETKGHLRELGTPEDELG